MGRPPVVAYLLSRRNLVGCGLAAIGLVLLLLDPVGPAGLALVVGFYLVGVAAARRHPGLERYGFDPKEVERGLQRLIGNVSGRVPPEVIIRVQRIEVLTRTQVLPRLDCLPPGSLDLYLVERTARDYVPAAIENYLRLPAAYVSTQAATRGVTPVQVVVDELDLLEAGMRRIAGVVQRADMDRALAHRRFLNDRLNRLDLSG